MNIEKKRLADLIFFTQDCRPDMHEPDESGITASVVGTRLDNAFGNFIDERCILGGFQEQVVVLHHEGGESYKINLATLIALARKAVIE